ncbi:MAG: hypothetical protein SFY80_10355 [Verrucomicrobiota bacterium]|nr:hypothetical protein [Verrucomicrobiota bacterium]
MSWKTFLSVALLSITATFAQAQTQKEDYDVVAKNLQPGGDLYAYINIRGDIAKLAVKVNQVIQIVRDLSPEMASKIPPLDYAQLEKHFQFSALSAAGVSSIKVEGTDYHRINIFYSLGGEPQGIWRTIPNKPEPVTIAKLTPPEATHMAEFTIDFNPLKESITGILTDVMGEQGKSMVDGVMQMSIPQTEVTYEALLQALSTRIGGFAVLEKNVDAEGNFQEAPIRLSKFLVRIRGAGPTLAQLRPWAESSLNATVTETASYLNVEIPTNTTQLGTNIVLQINKTDGDAYLSSSLACIDSCRTLTTTITDTDEYKKYASGLPTEVVSFTYITQNYADTMRESISGMMATLTTKQSQSAEQLAIMQPLISLMDGFIAHYAKAHLTVSQYKDGGFLSQTNSGVCAKDYVVMIGAVVPAGVLSAMAIPAFQKVRTTSQQKTILNNLRQIAATAQQYMLDNGVEEVKYSDIVGPGKYIEEAPKSVAGETYEDIVITIDTTSISATTSDGKTVTYDF